MNISYRGALRNITERILESNPRSVLFGLGATDPIGIFGTTKDLHLKFGKERVFDTPISEDCMLGFSLGLSLRGFYPINIHIRNDFLLLAANQIINSIAKYRSMYGGLYKCPMLIRAVIGRSWGQGAQHSQSLQTLFAHIPGLTVIMPASSQSVLDSYWEAATQFDGPVISLEHRFLYDYEFERTDNLKVNLHGSRIVKQGKDITVVAASYMVQEFQKIVPILETEFGIDIELIDIHSISHPDRKLILQSLEKTGNLIVADTSWASFGLAAEISRWILETNPRMLRAPLKNLCLAPTPCPTAKSLERFFYPQLADAINACISLKNPKLVPKWDGSNLGKLETNFKGPF